MLPIKTLPIVERWECAQCGRCCRGSLIWLDENDQEKLRQQGWDQHADLVGIKTVVREGWFGGRYRLAQRADGSCVFLLPDGRCRIHAEFGSDAKPLICRMFPLQFVPLEHSAILTTRRACPTAAADRGPVLSDYQSLARNLAKEGDLIEHAAPPPAITRNWNGSWEEVFAVLGSLERLITDQRFPLVRRLVHALRFCELFASGRAHQLELAKLRELCSILEESSTDVGDMFLDREPVPSAVAVLFRQTALEYVRLHPTFVATESWGQRWRMMWGAWKMVRGKGHLPRIHGGLSDTTFEAMERPLGHLDESVQRPFLRFFESQVASKQFAIMCRTGWSIIENFRALALAYPVGLWLLRWISTDRTPVTDDAIDVVTMLDRGQGFARLTGAHHRARVSTLAQLGGVERLAIWYAR